jgi:predicted acyl esterase
VVACEAVSFDVHVKLCEVTPRGKSLNICEGLTRVTRTLASGVAPAEQKVMVELHPVAIHLPVGTRLRLVISGGSFPLYNRNLGLGEAELEATEMVDQVVTVLGGALELPCVDQA